MGDNGKKEIAFYIAAPGQTGLIEAPEGYKFKDDKPQVDSPSGVVVFAVEKK